MVGQDSDMFDLAKRGFRTVTDKLPGGFIRAEPNCLYTTSEDFKRADPNPEVKRVMVIGGTGVGKSTLLNMLAGLKLVISEGDIKWLKKEGNGYKHIPEEELIFEATDDPVGVTQKAALAHLGWFDDEQKRFIAIDTVGVADPEFHNISSEVAQDKMKERALDLHDKLANLSRIDALLVLHGDAVSGRINNGVMEVLQMLEAKFPTADFWKNVAVAFTKCNECDKTWRLRMKRIHKQTEEIIKNKFPRSATVTVPIFNLGGLTEEGVDTKEEDFEKLWDFIQSRESLDTSNLLRFDDSFAQYRKVLDERDRAEARAKAARIYMKVVALLCVVLVLLFLRAWFVPHMFMWLALNSEWLGLTSTIVDELVVCAACIYYIGPQDVKNSMHLFYEDLQPHVASYIEYLINKLRGESRPHED